MKKKIWIVSHCILNPSSKVSSQMNEDLIEEERLRIQFLKTAIAADCPILQMPCPEFTMYGSKRWGHVKEQFDHPFFRSHCRKILQPIIEQIMEYKKNHEEIESIHILGIDGSPSCGVGLTCKGNWGGELSCNDSLDETISSLYMKEEPGVFIEELQALLAEHHLNIEIMPLSKAVIEKLNSKY